jgi:hypothetical protein
MYILFLSCKALFETPCIYVATTTTTIIYYSTLCNVSSCTTTIKYQKN